MSWKMFENYIIDTFEENPKLMLCSHLVNSFVILLSVYHLYAKTLRGFISLKAMFDLHIKSEFVYFIHNNIHLPITNIIFSILVLLACLVLSAFIYKWTVLAVIRAGVENGVDNFNESEKVICIALIILLCIINVLLLLIVFKWCVIFVALIIIIAVSAAVHNAALQE